MKTKDLEHKLELMRESRDAWRHTAEELAKWLMSEWVFVHESKVDEVDALLKPHIGGSDD